MPAYEHLLLENQLCFALYAATNAVTRAYREPLGKLGLTYPQYLAMVVLWARGTHTVKGLADALQLDSSTLTPLLKRLEAAGWLSRTRDASDERVVRIELTAAGKALRRPVSAIQSGVACRTRLPGTDFSALRTQLHALAVTLAGDEVLGAVQGRVAGPHPSIDAALPPHPKESAMNQALKPAAETVLGYTTGRAGGTPGVVAMVTNRKANSSAASGSARRSPNGSSRRSA